MSKIKSFLETYCEASFPYSHAAQQEMFDALCDDGIDESYETIHNLIANYERNHDLYLRCLDSRSSDEQCYHLRLLVDRVGYVVVVSQLSRVLGVKIGCYDDLYDCVADGRLSLRLLETIIRDWGLKMDYQTGLRELVRQVMQNGERIDRFVERGNEGLFVTTENAATRQIRIPLISESDDKIDHDVDEFLSHAENTL